MRTIVYVDGFNFYYGSCKGTPYRWVNPWRMAELLLPASSHQVVALYYFTAALKPQAHDPDRRQRQACYWRALRTIPHLTLIEGTFLESQKRMPRVESRIVRALQHQCARWPLLRPWAAPRTVSVLRSEEKGSDVNLASMLILDAAANCFDLALVVSNDTDLLMPIRIVREHFAKAVGVAPPVYFKNRNHNAELIAAADLAIPITKDFKPDIKAAQFTLEFEHPTAGRVYRPSSWA